MKLVFFTWLIYLYAQIIETSANGYIEDAISNDILCNKTSFDTYTHSPNVKVTTVYLDGLKESCKKARWNKTCDFDATPYMIGTTTEHSDFMGFHVTIYDIKACWAAALIVKVIDGGPSEENPIQISMVEKNPKLEFKFYYQREVNYQFYIRGIPNGKTVEKQWNSLDLCGEEVMKKLREKLTNTTLKGTNEPCNPNSTDIDEKIKYLCSLSEKERNTKTFDVDENCNVMVVTLDETAKGGKVSMVTLSAVSASIVLVFLISFIVYKIKQRNRLQYHLWQGEDEGDVNNNEEKKLSVMIIHRPGCDYLDKLVYQLSSFLMSYNLDVKVTFDGDDLSAHGGIASYLHQNIEACDYILVFITEKSGKNPLLKHRPYEFSLKLMEGLAVHETSTKAQFIPVYLTKYKQAVTMFPPFLKATSGYGYCIPQKNDQLIQKLFKGMRKPKKSNDRQVKDKLFRSEMKETVQKLLSSTHKCCSKEHCKKGTKYGSHTNLSSIWATTNATESVADDGNIQQMFNDIEEENEEENEMREIQYHKTLNFIQNMNVENLNVFNPVES